MPHSINLIFAIFIAFIAIPPVYAQQLDAKLIPTSKPSAIYLATLEWPPYSGSKLPNGGETVAKVVSVFKRMGYDPQIEFLPWTRAVRGTSGESPRYLGFFPEYPSENAHFILSGSLGESVIGLAHKKTNKLYLTTVTSLTNYRLGVVKDYINTQEIDQLIQSGAIKPSVAINDRQNLVSLLNNEIDIAVVDERVLQYLLEHDPGLMIRAKDKFAFNTTFSKRQTLHLAFSRYHPYSGLVENFNATLKQIDAEHKSSEM